MMPVALSTAEGSEMRTPMGVAVIGGLIASTLLTLVVVPVVYSLMDDLGNLRVVTWLKNRLLPSHQAAVEER